MKKILQLTFCISMFYSFSSQAQDITFSDDFESFSEGDKIGATSPIWRTWEGNSGADAEISTDEAHSGINSLVLFSQSENGGPADIILPFGDKYQEGVFKLEMWMYIADETGTYYNFQGEEDEGAQWVMQCYFKPNGEVEVQNSENVAQVTGDYPFEEWFKMSWEINLTDNVWTAFINDVALGSFSNPFNAIASMDLYPTVQEDPFTSLCYIDDVSFEFTEPKEYKLDASVVQINAKAKTIANSTVPVSTVIKNKGSDPITSLDITWQIGGQKTVESKSGFSIVKDESIEFKAANPVQTTPGANILTATVSNVNGALDENDQNDQASFTINAITPAEFKNVFIEEATGTWCGFCPRGKIFMDSMARDYPNYFIGVASHGGVSTEPMYAGEYSDKILAKVGSRGRYPSVIINREDTRNPIDVEDGLLDEVQKAPVAKLSVSAIMNLADRSMDVTVTATLLQDVSEQYKLGAVLIENGVTGTGKAYNQVNFYAGGRRGPMGGFEKLPNPVRAEDMVYDRVGRSIFDAFNGKAAFPATLAAGMVVSESFHLADIPEGWDESEFEIIGLLFNPSRSIDNAVKLDDVELTTSNVNIAQLQHVHISPNPATDVSYVHLNLTSNAHIKIQIINMSGQIQAQKSYGQLQGKVILPIAVNNFTPGLYSVLIQIEDEQISKRIVIE